MKDCRNFFIEGKWVTPARPNDFPVINPATEETIATIALGSAEDVDRAVAAAQRAFETYQWTTVEERTALLERIVACYKAHAEEMAEAISHEMGAPITLARKAQAASGLAHLMEMVRVMKRFPFEEHKGTTLWRREPVGVCGLITPWNWPMNQVVCKVAPALGAGCTVVLKPSEMAPLSSYLLAQILEEAGVPAGVFNLVNGDGPTVGAAMAAHPGIDMISFTGSTRAGVAVAEGAAATVKRVTQELGGKSANILLDDVELDKAVREGVQACFRNSGQSCNAPTRMLVPRVKLADAERIAREESATIVVGDPRDESTALGPLASKRQFERVQAYLEKGLAEGAKLVAGGPGKPDGMARGYFVRPTVFSNVRNDMTIAREEIFGPVLCLLPYSDEQEAVAIANDTPYGLAAFVSSGDRKRAVEVAKKIRAGNVHVNNARVDFGAPFGGYKKSGNGREWGEAGLEEFLEKKAILGWAEAAK